MCDFIVFLLILKLLVENDFEAYYLQFIFCILIVLVDAIIIVIAGYGCDICTIKPHRSDYPMLNGSFLYYVLYWLDKMQRQQQHYVLDDLLFLLNGIK